MKLSAPNSGSPEEGDRHTNTPALKMLRRRLNELDETKRWVHHVADLSSGKVLAFPLDRPISSLSRAHRLSGLGHSVDSSIFDGPWYKLTPNSPFQVSPQARLILDGNPNYYYDYLCLGGEPPGLIVWTIPKEKVPLSFVRVAQFTFNASSLFGFNLASIALQFGAAYPGKVGHILVVAGNHQVQFEINDVNAAHTLDIIYQAQSHPAESANFEMYFSGNLSFITFESFSFGPSLPVLISAAT